MALIILVTSIDLPTHECGHTSSTYVQTYIKHLLFVAVAFLSFMAVRAYLTSLSTINTHVVMLFKKIQYEKDISGPHGDRGLGRYIIAV